MDRSSIGIVLLLKFDPTTDVGTIASELITMVSSAVPKRPLAGQQAAGTTV